MKIERLVDCVGVRLFAMSFEEAKMLRTDFGCAIVVHAMIVRTPQGEMDLIALGDDGEAMPKCRPEEEV